LCFESDRFYRRPVFWPLLVAALPAVLWLLDQDVETALVWQALGYSAALFVCCMVCHGELARLKPGPRHLTSFYLTVSAGGAAGGVFVALVAPLVFERYFELHLGLWACGALAMLALWRERAPLRSRRRPYVALAGLAGVAALAGAAVALYRDADRQVSGVVASARNFYGILQVAPYTSATDGDVYYCLNHGNVLHGCQYTSEPLRFEPTTYYGRQSGIGLALASRGIERPVRVGVVGLGTGTIAAYGREGDAFRFYEINPDVMRFATTYFTYLGDSKAEWEIVLGDARLSLEREAAQGYDVLALDAFSGDAVPLHLLTVEAFEIYRRHLKPDGILAAHISNRFLDLKPVILGLADHFGMAVAVIDAGDEDKEELSPSLWVLLSADPASLQDDAIRTAASPVDASPSALRLWTDDYSDLFSVLVIK